MIAVLTYDAPHRKTYDVLCALKTHRIHNVTVLAMPFVERKKKHTPIYQHRPPVHTNVRPGPLAVDLGYGSAPCKDYIELSDQLMDLTDLEMVLIAGAGILPADIVNPFIVINSHPGWLPYTRGLDSLKWAIRTKGIIGVTTHEVDIGADTGLLIAQQQVPVYPCDTFHAVAYRQYEMEITMLVEAITHQREGTFAKGEGCRGRTLKSNFPAKGRMGAEDEEIMMRTFNEWTRMA